MPVYRRIFGYKRDPGQMITGIAEETRSLAQKACKESVPGKRFVINTKEFF